MQHPVTTEYFDAKRQITETIKAVKNTNFKRDTNIMAVAQH